jgi:hypothetical protein
MRNSFNNKVDRIRRKGRQLSVMADPNSSQSERKQALRELKEDRQRPASAYAVDAMNGLPNQIDPGRPSIEDDMTRRVTNKYGYPVFSGGYEAYSSAEVRTAPRVLPRRNVSNYDYQDPIHSPLKADMLPSAAIVQSMTQRNIQYTESVVGSLKRQSDAQGVKIQTVFERFERTDPNVTHEQLYVIAAKLGVITEKYESTAGKWVVINPFGNPTTPEEILYNQGGISRKNDKALTKDQVGTYWRGADKAYDAVYYPQLPPAVPVPGSEQTKYYAGRPGTVKSQQSLRNPKRGDDYIRDSRVRAAMEEETMAYRRTSSIPKRKYATAISTKPQKPATTDKTMSKADARYFRGDQKLTDSQRRKRLRSEEIDRLHEMAEATPLKWQKEKYLKKAKALKNQQVAEDAAVKGKARRENEDLRKRQAVQRSADAVTMMANPNRQDFQKEEIAYQRHIRLLESAKQMLSQGSTGNLLY